jgi:hypothetical protein
MVFLLLRFLTMPAPALPAAAVVENVVRQERPADMSVRDARANLDLINASPAKIRALLRVAHDPLRASCVAQRVEEAQVHTMLARDEMQRLDGAPATAGPQLNRDRDDRAYAAKRLAMLAQRTREIERTARSCVDDELSTVNAVKVEVIAPGTMETEDVTAPPPPTRPMDLRPAEQ